MASTEQRTGFRFGWGSKGDSDKSASQEENGSSGTDSNAGTPDAAAEANAPTADPADAETESSNGHHAQSATAEAPSTSTTEAAPEHPKAVASAPEAWPVSDSLETAPAPTPAEPRSSGFLADLMRAMQSAAEQNRKQVTDRFRDDGRTLIEAVRSRSGEDLNELRRAADADVASIREWSKAEIARIKAETDERIETRKAELDRQVESHAALIDREVEKVEARISSFEQHMEAFFARLQNVDDPTTFASVAQEMPEPPSIEALGAQARAEAQAEMSHGAFAAHRAASPLTQTESRGTSTGSDEGVRWDASDAATDDSLRSVSQWAVPAPQGDWETSQSATPESWAPAAEPAESVSAASASTQQSPTDDLHRSMANGAGAFDSALTVPPPASTDEVATASPGWQDAAPASDPWSEPMTTAAEPVASETAADETARPTDDTPLVYGAPAPLVAEALASSPSPESGQDRAPGDRTAGSWPSSFEADPRLAALGIDGPQGASISNQPFEAQPTPAAVSDPWAAPAEAAPASPNDPFAMPGEAFGSDAGSSESPAARLAGLVPSSELPANGRTADNAGQPVPSQVIVTGLMSVASIASFKRHLSRIPGVQSVGVSSGPDGEFIFKTTHEPQVALADVIPTLPGFGAEVVNSAEGTINVAAHDPEAEA